MMQPSMGAVSQSFLTSPGPAPDITFASMGAIPTTLPPGSGWPVMIPSMGVVSGALPASRISGGPTTLPPNSTWTRNPSMGYVPGTLPPSGFAEEDLFKDSSTPEETQDSFFGSAFVSRGWPSLAPQNEETEGVEVNQEASTFGSAFVEDVYHAGDMFKDGAYIAGTSMKDGAYFAGQALYDGAEMVGNEVEKGNVGVMFLISGIFGMLMLILIPIWDGISLLHDPVWMYMAGSKWPSILIASSIMIPVLFILTVGTLLLCGGRGARTELTMFGASGIFILLLGSVLLIAAEPIGDTARWAKSQFLSNCETSSLTHPLYAEYQKLQKLRSESSCISQFSIEQCAGYMETNQATVLKLFEQRLECAGFCFYPLSASNTTDNMGAANSYPPALFTSIAYQGSCSAMAGRDMGGFAYDISRQLMWEGFFLVGAAVLQGLLMLFGLLVRVRVNRGKSGIGYGTIEAPTKEPPDTIVTSFGEVRRRPKVTEM